MPVSPEERPPRAHASGTFALGGELSVHRLGFGAMRLPGARGEPRPRAAREMLREAVRLGVDLIDTAHAYGRSEDLIAEALHPYPEGLLIATKGGLRRGGNPDGRPERLRADCEDSLRRLRLETIDLWQLHRIDPEVPLEEQFGAIRELRDEGKIRFVGVSEVSVEELRRARQLIEIATVQNRFNLAERAAEDVLRACEADGLGFLPWAPIGMGDVLDSMDALASAAARHGATQAQMALAWLLHRSPVVLPIPGTGSPEHLRENLGAALIELSEDDLAALEGGAPQPS
ncbi:MAG: aldo/keto reductase [Actinomycetota bacterium]|jgi:aryl-alcohol dehydrogenase-like predicted oxidoreductase|nr:aldo/keto reductase [Actinomycetota bacterium]